VAYVFKTEPRRKGVHLAFVRAFAGTIARGDALFVAPHGRALGPAALVDVEGEDYTPLEHLEEGAIGALAFGEDGSIPATGDTIGGLDLGLTFERVKPPEPVLEITVEAAEAATHERMLKAIVGLCADDPSLRSGVDRESGRMVLAGMGELHLEIAIERLERELGEKIRAGRPQVRARHFLEGVGLGEATVHHPNGRARVRVEVEVAPLVEPADRSLRPGAQLTVSAPPTDRPEWREAMLSGLESAAGVDGRGPWQLLGARIAVLAIESSGSELVPVMFRDAAEWAALRAIEAAGITHAEPWCVLSLIVPDAAVGRVVGDLMRRRARVRRTESRGRVQELTADAPLAELLGYANDLRSMTAGRGQLSLEPVGYRGATRAEGRNEASELSTRSPDKLH
jgi:elongation factor G